MTVELGFDLGENINELCVNDLCQLYIGECKAHIRDKRGQIWTVSFSQCDLKKTTIQRFT